MSKELNHFGVIAGLFQQMGGHSSRFVLFCSFWRLFTIKMIKSVKVFPLSFWKIITKNSYFIKFKPTASTCKMAAKWFNSLDTNSRFDACGFFQPSLWLQWSFHVTAASHPNSPVFFQNRCHKIPQNYASKKPTPNKETLIVMMFHRSIVNNFVKIMLQN